MPRRNRNAKKGWTYRRLRIQRGFSDHSPCTKRRWRTEEAALEAMANLNPLFPRKWTPVRAYFHDRCGGYHWTSKPYFPNSSRKRQDSSDP